MEELKVNPSDFISERQGRVRDIYKIGSKIGMGSYGSVRKIVHRLTNEMRIVKTIYKSALKSPEDEEFFFNEVGILRRLDHPHIVRLFEFFQDEKNYYIVTEYCSGGELFDKILGNTFTEATCAEYMKQILSVLVYLHDRNIVHRDLKPENFVFSSNSESAVIKVIDFGSAKIFTPGEFLTTKIGTPYYIAPEVLRREYTEKCDVWSAGINMYVMLCGFPPFAGDTHNKVLENVQIGNFTFPSPEWDSITFDAKDLISRMLSYDPEERISARQAMEHPWIRNAGSLPPYPGNTQRYMENLKSFRADQRLQKATFTYISSQLATKQEREELMKLFKELDTDFSGTLSRQELIEGFHKLYNDDVDDVEGEVDKIMEAVDIDRSGEIDYSEFVTATLNKRRLLSDERLLNAFKMFDVDNSGKIDKQEIKAILGKYQTYDDNLWDQIISEVDLNGDGEIDLSEFKQMMKKFIL